MNFCCLWQQQKKKIILTDERQDGGMRDGETQLLCSPPADHHVTNFSETSEKL